MARSLKFVGLLSAVLLVAGIVYAQVDSSREPVKPPDRTPDTQKMVDLAREIYAELGASAEGQTCRADYTVSTTMQGPNDSLIELAQSASCVGNDRYLTLTSPEMSLYQDTVVGVMIVPSVREIQIFSSTPAELRRAHAATMRKMYDELFADGTVLECRVNAAGDECRIRLLPSAELMEGSQVAEVEIVFDPAARRIDAVHLAFDERARYRSMSVTYDRIECGRESSETDTAFSALAMVYGPNGAVKSEYRGFEVIDHRATVEP